MQICCITNKLAYTRIVCMYVCTHIRTHIFLWPLHVYIYIRKILQKYARDNEKLKIAAAKEMYVYVCIHTYYIRVCQFICIYIYFLHVAKFCINANICIYICMHVTYIYMPTSVRAMQLSIQRSHTHIYTYVELCTEILVNGPTLSLSLSLFLLPSHAYKPLCSKAINLNGKCW